MGFGMWQLGESLLSQAKLTETYLDIASVTRFSKRDIFLLFDVNDRTG
jgi:hypothetical protein